MLKIYGSVCSNYGCVLSATVSISVQQTWDAYIGDMKQSVRRPTLQGAALNLHSSIRLRQNYTLAVNSTVIE